MNRRAVLAGLAASAVAGCATTSSQADAFAALEARSGGRLGVAILDTRDGRLIGHRASERFGMCSTFKLPLAALALAEIDAGRLQGGEIVRYTRAELVSHAPVTGPNIDKGLSWLALAEAAQVTSDNPAANLLIRRLGGPARVTAGFRAWGDPLSRLDDYEPAMNLVMPGGVANTTTPHAMARLAARILTTDTLSPMSRERLVGWMVATRTGAKRIRAGLRPGWKAGDKTGTAIDDRPDGMVNKYNDVAIIYPPGRAPLVIAAYLDAAAHFLQVRPEDEAILAEVGRMAADRVQM